MASICGTHLGHNLPDGKGDRYCIDLVCVAGQPTPANATFSSGGALALAPWRSHPVYLSLPTRTSGFNYRHRTVGGSATARVPGAPVGQSLGAPARSATAAWLLSWHRNAFTATA